MTRNAFMLKGNLSKNGYDWWWHSLVGINSKTKKSRPFFIEYYVINPALGAGTPVIPSPSDNKGMQKPSYAMIKAGSWGRNAKEINNFYSISDFSASTEKMDVKIGENTATETQIKGSVFMSVKDSKNHPEYMSDAGKMKWNLAAKKVISHGVGYGASKPFRMINAFQMYWHIAGMKTEYSGKIVFDGEKYDVLPETCIGYQDKNWGSDYTNPWIWLNCNSIRKKGSKKAMKNSSLVAGGGTPVLFGIPIQRKIVIAFYCEGKLYEFNFSKFWQVNRQHFEFREDKKFAFWDISASNLKNKINMRFRCDKKKMLFIGYMNPKGEKNHTKLWNGGHAEGTITLYERSIGGWAKIGDFEGEMGGCEYGEY
ncbi:MAG: hypothetical protein KAJ91_01055 [Candidatus Aenigmarchaeota archaeon]|nr:hypothetical protein [Candidatus Aenigmarchaeota archaeon]